MITATLLFNYKLTLKNKIISLKIINSININNRILLYCMISYLKLIECFNFNYLFILKYYVERICKRSLY